MSSVFIGDLDDFLAPSQSCVNPLFASSSSTEGKKEVDDKGRPKVTLETTMVWNTDERIGGAGGGGAADGMMPDLIKTKKGGGAATVSLNDCLACSGCVTSAETVLISQQSGEEFLRALGGSKGSQAVVLAISPQSLASLAVHFDLDPATTFKCLKSFFHRLSIEVRGSSSSGDQQCCPLHTYLYNTSAASNISLMEAAAEFITRFRHHQQAAIGANGQSSSWEAPAPSRALSSTHDVMNVGEGEIPTPASALKHERLPMLASACPGWICYAEKTTPAAIPYLSTTKSPQQILGTLVKEVLAPASGLKARDVFMVGIMPCYDKKLEASRKDFFHEDWDVPEVDLVLTTREILGLIEEQAGRSKTDTVADVKAFFLQGIGGGDGDDMMDVEEEGGHSASQSPFTLKSAEPLLSGLSCDGAMMVGPVEAEGGSGGFLEYIFRAAARELFGVEVLGPLTYQQGRNNDYKEVTLEVGGSAVLRFALAYGFRNIQSVVSKLKKGSCPLHFVEVMACPSGCLNGGGQLKANSSEQPDSSSLSSSSKERVAKIKSSFEHRLVQSSEQSAIAQYVYRNIFASDGGKFGLKAKSLFHTRFHAVPKLELANPSVIKW